MSGIEYSAKEGKQPAISASEAAELIRAKRARSPVRLNQLMKNFQARGVPTPDIIAAMAASPHLINAIGAGRQRL
jgi:hypothetical protein